MLVDLLDFSAEHLLSQALGQGQGSIQRRCQCCTSPSTGRMGGGMSGAEAEQLVSGLNSQIGLEFHASHIAPALKMYSSGHIVVTSIRFKGQSVSRRSCSLPRPPQNGTFCLYLIPLC